MIGSTFTMDYRRGLPIRREVLKEVVREGTRHYIIRDPDTGEEHEAVKATFDRTFKTGGGEVLPRNPKGANGVKQKRGKKRK